MKIAAFIPTPDDFTSYCRAVGPLNRLRKDFPNEFEITYFGHRATEWWHVQQADICFVQRPHNQAHLELCKLIKLSNQKLWIDYDDDLLNVPIANPTYEILSQPTAQSYIKNAIHLADLVTVSTPKLWEMYGPYLKKSAHIVTVPNGYDSTLFEYHKQHLIERNKIVWMRGSPTHDEDVECFADEIAEAMNSNPEWKFLCYGFMPWRITTQLKPESWGQRRFSMMQYFYDSWKIKPSVMVIPLKNNSFNQAKSNAAAIEGAMTGSLVVAPIYLKEFHDLPSAVFYDEKAGSMKAALKIAMSISDTLEGSSRVNELREYVQECLELGEMNSIRRSYLHSLVKNEMRADNKVYDSSSRSRGIMEDEARPSV